jgi:prepilin-type N-terminal cleavage/methylation domain-containing protein
MIVRDRVAHRGVTLIEMLVVITVLGVLLDLCAVTIQLLMRVGSNAQARRGAAAALGRLAEQFREDVHACDDAQLRPSAGLRLTLDPRVVVDYEVRDGRVARVESTDGQANRHESYDLGPNGSAVFERRDDGPRRFLALVVSHKASSGRPDPPHPRELLALVGKDRIDPSRSGGGQAR